MWSKVCRDSYVKLFNKRYKRQKCCLSAPVNATIWCLWLRIFFPVNVVHAKPGAWQSAAECRNTAGDHPVRRNADHTNPGAWLSAAEGRNAAGNQPVRGNANYANPGAWQSAAEGRNAAGNRPVRGNADHVNPGAWQPTGNRPVRGSADHANPGAWQSTTEGRNTAGERPVCGDATEGLETAGNWPVHEIPTLPTPGLVSPSQRTETQLGTDVRDPPVRDGPTAGASMKGAKLSWNMKGGGGGDRPDDTLDSGMCYLQSHGTGPVLESLLPDTIIDGGTGGVDASTPITRPNYQARPVLLVHCQELKNIPRLCGLVSWLPSVQREQPTDQPVLGASMVGRSAPDSAASNCMLLWC